MDLHFFMGYKSHFNVMPMFRLPGSTSVSWVKRTILTRCRYSGCLVQRLFDGLYHFNAVSMFRLPGSASVSWAIITFYRGAVLSGSTFV